MSIQAPVKETVKNTEKIVFKDFNVILHNDDVNTFDHVIKTLVKVIPQKSTAQAEQDAHIVHTEGKQIVHTCPQELAEHFVAQLRSAGLTATFEAC